MKKIILFGLLALTSCSKVPSSVLLLDARDVSRAGGRPTIKRIVDIGTGRLPIVGNFKINPTDNKTEIGELLLILGSSFGKQPTVNIGGRPAQVLAHVDAGGLIVRVPTQIDPGMTVEVSITNDYGTSSINHPIRRMGVAILGKELFLFEVAIDGVTTSVFRKINLEGAKTIEISSDGSVAYIGGSQNGKASFWVVDLTSGAQILYQRTLPGTQILDLTTSKDASRGALITDTHLVYFDTQTMTRPVFFQPQPFSSKVIEQEPLAISLSPDGNVLALLLSKQNMLGIFDAQKPSEISPPYLLEILPDSRLSVVQDLVFSPDGTNIWVTSGDTVRSISGGYQPTLVTLIKIPPMQNGNMPEIEKTWVIEKAGAPIAMAVGQGEPEPAGTSVRVATSNSVVYIGTIPSDALKGNAELSAAAFEISGKIIRSRPTAPKEIKMQGKWLLGSLDVAGSTQVVVALVCKNQSKEWECMLTSQKVWEANAKPKNLILGRISRGEIKSPYHFGIVRIQP